VLILVGKIETHQLNGTHLFGYEKITSTVDRFLVSEDEMSCNNSLAAAAPTPFSELKPPDYYQNYVLGNSTA
jgi:hypothetical protein